jgi:hypothetical protein
MGLSYRTPTPTTLRLTAVRDTVSASSAEILEVS